MSSLQANFRKQYDPWLRRLTEPGVDLAERLCNEIGFVVSSTSDLEDYGLDIESFRKIPVEVEVSQVWDDKWNKSYIDIPYSKAIQVQKERAEFWQFNKSMTHVHVVHHSVIKLVPYHDSIRKGFGLKSVRLKEKHDGRELYTQEPFYRVPFTELMSYAVLGDPGGKNG